MCVCVREWCSSVGNVIRVVVSAFVIHALEQNGAFAEIIAPRRPAECLCLTRAAARARERQHCREKAGDKGLRSDRSGRSSLDVGV